MVPDSINLNSLEQALAPLDSEARNTVMLAVQEEFRVPPMTRLTVTNESDAMLSMGDIHKFISGYSLGLDIDKIEQMMLTGQIAYPMAMKKAPVIGIVNSESGFQVKSPDQDLAKILHSNLRMVLPRTIDEILTFLEYGAFYAEITWEPGYPKDYGLTGDVPWWVIADINGCHPRTIHKINRSKKGNFQGFEQDVNWQSDPIKVDLERALIIPNNGNFGNLAGISVLEPIYVWWFWFELVWRSFLRFLQRAGVGVVLVKAPSKGRVSVNNRTVKAMDWALQLAASMHKTNYAVVPSDFDRDSNKELWAVDFLKTSDHSEGQQFIEALNLLSDHINRFLLTGGGKGEEKDEFDVMLDTERIMSHISLYLSRYVLRKALRYNGSSANVITMEAQGANTRILPLLFKLMAVAGNTAGDALQNVDWRELFQKGGVPTLTEEEVEKLKKEAEEKQKEMFQQKQQAGQEKAKGQPGGEGAQAARRDNQGKAEKLEMLDHLRETLDHPVIALGVEQVGILEQLGLRVADEPITLFNPYHDELGRFTNKGGSVGIGTPQAIPDDVDRERYRGTGPISSTDAFTDWSKAYHRKVLDDQSFRNMDTDVSVRIFDKFMPSIRLWGKEPNNKELAKAIISGKDAQNVLAVVGKYRTVQEFFWLRNEYRHGYEDFYDEMERLIGESDHPDVGDFYFRDENGNYRIRDEARKLTIDENSISLFNPYHDPKDGRFTTKGGSSGSGGTVTESKEYKNWKKAHIKKYQDYDFWHVDTESVGETIDVSPTWISWRGTKDNKGEAQKVFNRLDSKLKAVGKFRVLAQIEAERADDPRSGDFFDELEKLVSQSEYPNVVEYIYKDDKGRWRTTKEARKWEVDNKNTVSLFNPYHDELGRFTTKEGTAGVAPGNPDDNLKQVGVKEVKPAIANDFSNVQYIADDWKINVELTDEITQDKKALFSSGIAVARGSLSKLQVPFNKDLTILGTTNEAQHRAWWSATGTEKAYNGHSFAHSPQKAAFISPTVMKKFIDEFMDARWQSGIDTLVHELYHLRAAKTSGERFSTYIEEGLASLAENIGRIGRESGDWQLKTPKSHSRLIQLSKNRGYEGHIDDIWRAAGRAAEGHASSSRHSKILDWVRWGDSRTAYEIEQIVADLGIRTGPTFDTADMETQNKGIELFNPYHDELGRFTTSSGKVGPGAISDEAKRVGIERVEVGEEGDFSTAQFFADTWKAKVFAPKTWDKDQIARIHESAGLAKGCLDRIGVALSSNKIVAHDSIKSFKNAYRAAGGKGNDASSYFAFANLKTLAAHLSPNISRAISTSGNQDPYSITGQGRNEAIGSLVHEFYHLRDAVKVSGEGIKPYIATLDPGWYEEGLATIAGSAAKVGLIDGDFALNRSNSGHLFTHFNNSSGYSNRVRTIWEAALHSQGGRGDENTRKIMLDWTRRGDQAAITEIATLVADMRSGRYPSSAGRLKMSSDNYELFNPYHDEKGRFSTKQAAASAKAWIEKNKGKLAAAGLAAAVVGGTVAIGYVGNKKGAEIRKWGEESKVHTWTQDGMPMSYTGKKTLFDEGVQNTAKAFLGAKSTLEGAIPFAKETFAEQLTGIDIQDKEIYVDNWLKDFQNRYKAIYGEDAVESSEFVWNLAAAMKLASTKLTGFAAGGYNPISGRIRSTIVNSKSLKHMAVHELIHSITPKPILEGAMGSGTEVSKIEAVTDAISRGLLKNWTPDTSYYKSAKREWDHAMDLADGNSQNALVFLFSDLGIDVFGTDFTNIKLASQDNVSEMTPEIAFEQLMRGHFTIEAAQLVIDTYWPDNEAVKLFNPYHDELGRFTTGTGTGTSAVEALGGSGKGSEVDPETEKQINKDISDVSKELDFKSPNVGIYGDKKDYTRAICSDVGTNKGIQGSRCNRFASRTIAAHYQGKVYVGPRAAEIYKKNKKEGRYVVSHELIHSRPRKNGMRGPNIKTSTSPHTRALMAGVEEGSTDLLARRFSGMDHKTKLGGRDPFYMSQMRAVATMAVSASGGNRKKAWEIIDNLHYNMQDTKTIEKLMKDASMDVINTPAGRHKAFYKLMTSRKIGDDSLAWLFGD